MKKNGLVLLFILIVVLVFSSVVAAQDGKGAESPDSLVPIVVITDGTATFEFDNSLSGLVPSADLRITGVDAGSDQLFQAWWWYRVAGDTQETYLPTAPDAIVTVGDTSTLTWNDVNGRGFSAVLVVTIAETGGGTGATVQQDLTITNLSTAQNLDITVFTYADPDLGGTAGGDSAALNTANNIIDLTDGATATTGQFASNFVSNGSYAVTTFAALRTLLNNALVDDLANTGLPFGPGDFTGGFQDGTRTILPTESMKYTASIAINGTAPTAVGLNDVVATTPGNVVVVGLLVLVLGLSTAVVLKRKQQLI